MTKLIPGKLYSLREHRINTFSVGLEKDGDNYTFLKKGDIVMFCVKKRITRFMRNEGLHYFLLYISKLCTVCFYKTRNLEDCLDNL